MPKFKAKPGIEIEAFHWNGEPPSEWPDWARDNLKLRYEITCIYIDGIHGAARVNRGDWIICKSPHDIYPCLDSVFRERWDPA